MHVAVIGAGLAGVSVAYYLQQAGAQVTVVDRQPGAAQETSYANGAMLTPSLADPWNSPGVFGQLVRNLGRSDAAMLLRLGAIPGLAGWGIRFLANSSPSKFDASYRQNMALALYSQELLGELRLRTGIEFEFQEGGILKVFEDAAALEDAVAVGHRLKQAGLTHRLLNVDELVQLEPMLQPGSERLVGAVHYPDDQVGNAGLYCTGLTTWLAGEGVCFRFGERVRGFDSAGGMIRAVETSAGRIDADAVVLAAGSFSADLARQLKIGVPVVPAKGYSITLDTPASPRYPVVDDALHAAIVPLGARLRVAGTAEFAGFDPTVREERIANLLRLLTRVYPQIEVDDSPLNAWMGFRPMSADGRPLLGQLGPDNLYLNTGHGALGWTLANASGKVVSEQILGLEATIDPTPFLASRVRG